MAALVGCWTTMIGSLPHKVAGDALGLLSRFPLSIPAWPQLPKRSFLEGMTLQYSEGLPGIRRDDAARSARVERDGGLLDAMAAVYEQVLAEQVDAFAVSAECAAGLHAFLEAMCRQGGRAPFVKGQVVGAFTCGLSLSDNEGRAVWFDEQYRDILVKVMAMKARWMIGALGRCAEQVLIFFDEPIFAALGTPAYLGIQDDEVVAVLGELAEAVHGAGALIGVHCCGGMDWSLLARSGADIISFDAYGYGENLALYPEAIGSFLERGGTLALGIVPTADDAVVAKEDSSSLAKRFDSLLDHLAAKGVPRELVRRRFLLTPSCGMGTLSAASAEKVLRMLAELRGLVG